MPGWWTIKTSINTINRPDPIAPPFVAARLSYLANNPVIASNNQSINPNRPIKPTQFRYWIQGSVESIGDVEMTIRDHTGEMLINIHKCPSWQIPRANQAINQPINQSMELYSPIEPGSYVQVMGVVRNRQSMTGVSMLAHMVKDLTDEGKVRERIWRQEVEEMETYYATLNAEAQAQ